MRKSKVKSVFGETFKRIPNSIINFISILAGLAGFFTPIIGFFKIKRNIAAGKIDDTYNIVLFIVCIVMALFCIILLLKVIKYKQLLQQSRNVSSLRYYCLIHDFRNTYYDMLSYYKKDNLTIGLLTKMVQDFLEKSLDYICEIYSEFTHQEVSACIKYIDGIDNEIDIDTAAVKTFVRSKNSDVRRHGLDLAQTKKILIRDNTDFYSIIGPNRRTNKSYFYQRDLLEYKKNENPSYKNTTLGWEEFYKGTIVVPIRIANKRLFYKNEQECYDVIGFLCIDSMSTDAFLKDQERYNVYIAKAFAAEIYIILNQYKYYLSKLTGGDN